MEFDASRLGCCAHNPLGLDLKMRPQAGGISTCRARGAPDGTRGGHAPRDHLIPHRCAFHARTTSGLSIPATTDAAAPHLLPHQCSSVFISGSKFPPSRESTQPAIETRSEFRYRIDAATPPTRSRRPRPGESGESCRTVRRSGGCLCGRLGGRRRGRSPHGACGRCCAHGRRR